MALDSKDLEIIGCLMSKNAHDIGNAVTRSHALIDERMDKAESRFRTRITDVKDTILSLPFPR